MFNILYYNQHRLNLKSIYDSITFKTILEKANKDLIRFFDKLYTKIRTFIHIRNSNLNYLN